MVPLISQEILRSVVHDTDASEAQLRQIVRASLEQHAPPLLDDAMVASYFFALRSTKLSDLITEISYHATSGTRHVPPGSLLEACTGRGVGIDAFDAEERVGLVHIAFPLKMLLHPDGHLTSVDILHTVANAVIFDFYEHLDARLVALQLPEAVLRTFPGPAYGPRGVREMVGLTADQPAFGTILKPTAGITPEEVGALVAGVAANPLFIFVKEDENLYPDLSYSPVAERTRRAVQAIEQAREARGGRGLIFAPHITGAPHQILDTVRAVCEAGATGVMFSETFSGGTVRMVREATRNLPRPPAIYGHNAGIGVKTRGIWREIIDFLARLDGIDFRQTAPVRPGAPYIRPFGDEWRASESALTRELPSIRSTMIARAGALDQGNIGPNLADAEARGLAESVLFLAGSAINSIKDAAGHADASLGAEAMLQAIALHRSGEVPVEPLDDYVTRLGALARQRRQHALVAALKQRYPNTTI
jgi:ribulose 1,5-bisphosphate carboxylase large subunit-like protein